MSWSVISNRVLKTFIGCAIIFIALTINHLVRRIIKHEPVHIVCPLGRSEVCK